MKFKIPLNNKKMLFFPALGIGALLFFLAIVTRSSLPIKPSIQKQRLVEIQTLEKREITPKIIGFGVVKPKFIWQSIAEVSGKVIFKHLNLEKGEILPNKLEVLRIDPFDYELSLIQVLADLSASQIKLTKLSQEKENITNTLNIEKQRLTLTKKEFSRQKNLLKKRLASQSNVDQQNQTVLSQQKLVQDMTNQLALYSDERKLAKAEIKIQEAKVQEAQRLLDKTHIVLPEMVRIAEVNVEKNEAVNLQKVMIIGHGIKTMEIEAQVSIHDMKILAKSLYKYSCNDLNAIIPGANHLDASIELNIGQLKAKWQAKVARISGTIDSTQATIGVILEVEQDYTQLISKGVPPLINGMFVQATIEGQKQLHWVVPERALHENNIYLMNKKHRLDILPVTVLFRRQTQVAISGEIHTGDKLILNDLLPAIKGMSLKESKVKLEQDTSSK